GWVGRRAGGLQAVYGGAPAVPSCGLGSLQALEQLHLTGVVQVVGGDALDQVHDARPPRRQGRVQTGGVGGGDRLAQGPVLGGEQPDVATPVLVPEGVGEREPVAARQREGAALAAAQTAAGGVLPVGGVGDDLG